MDDLVKTSRAFYLPGNDIPTSRIIKPKPNNLFDVTLLKKDGRHSFLVVDRNFGWSGSKNKEAAKTVHDWGIEVIIALSLSIGFRKEVVSLGILCASIASYYHLKLLKEIKKGRRIVTFDSKQSKIWVGSKKVYSLPIKPYPSS